MRPGVNIFPKWVDEYHEYLSTTTPSTSLGSEVQRFMICRDCRVWDENGKQRFYNGFMIKVY